MEGSAAGVEGVFCAVGEVSGGECVVCGDCFDVDVGGGVDGEVEGEGGGQEGRRGRRSLVSIAGR